MVPTRQLRVLLVEDNPGDAMLIQTMLGEQAPESFGLEIVDRLSAARNWLASATPDAVLLDLGLPDSKGLDTIDDMASCCAGTPIIVLTGLDDEDTALQAIQRGAQDYLPKGGFDERLLARTIRYSVERAAAEESIRVTEERYRKLFAHAREAILVVDDYSIEEMNPEAEKLTGWTRDELLGRNIQHLIYPDDRELVDGHYQERLRGEAAPAQYEFRILRKDRTIRWVSVSTGFVEWEGEKASLALLTDVTERREAAERSQRLLERQTAINELTLSFGTTASAERIYELLSVRVRQLLETDTMYVSSYDPERREIRAEFVVAGDKRHDAAAFPVLRLAETGSGLQSQVIRTGEPLLIGDYASARTSHARCYKMCDDGKVRTLDEDGQEAPIGTQSAMLVPMKSEEQVIGVLQLQSIRENAFDQDALDLVAGLANVTAIALQNSTLVEQARVQAEQLRAAFEGVVQTVAAATETRDAYTAGHQLRVAKLAEAIGRELQLSENAIESIRIASHVHDIGKLGVPAEILTKPGALTDIEFQIIRAHAEDAYRILEPIDFPWPIAEIVYQHHERIDGSGYPRQLSGKDVMIAAQIVGIADVIEAMASHRPYRPALGLDCALMEIEAQRGRHFDESIVDACLRVFNERGFRFDASDELDELIGASA